MLFEAIVNISRLSPLVACIITTLLGCWIYFYNRNSLTNILFAIFSFDLAIWAYACYIQSVVMNYKVALLFDQILYSVAVVAPALFLHCISLFTKKNRAAIINFSYFLGLVFFFLNWTSFFRQGIGLNFGMRYVTVPAVGWYLYLLAYTLIIVIAMFDLVQAMLAAKNLERHRLFLVFCSFIVLLIGGQSYFILILKKFSYLIDSILNLTSSIFLTLYNLMMAVIITKFRFLNIWVAIKKTTAYVILFILLAAFCFVGVSFYNFTSPYIASPFLDNILLFVELAVLMTLSGFLFIPLRQFIQTSYERAFIKGWYDFDKVVAKISERLIPVYTAEDALLVIRSAFQEIEFEVVSVCLAEKAANGGEAAKTKSYILFRDAGVEKETINLDHPLIKHLSQNKEISYYDRLPPDVKALLNDSKVLKGVLYLPFHSSDELEAFMVLGQKASEADYDQQDINLFKTVLNQTSLVFDRIRPYEQIRKDFEANQKKLYDTERLLARSEKIAALATLIQEYNHEIRTPLGLMSAYLASLPDETSQLPDFKEVKKELLVQIYRASDIVDSTLRLSQPKERKEIDLDVNQVIESALKLYQPIGIPLKKELSVLPRIKGDCDDLQLVFVNLLKNAREAIENKGEIKIKTYLADDHGQALICAEVSDTGIGIPKENMEKIFEPFYSSHVTKGRGLGLSLVFRIIREHLATIEVKSQVGKGSTFILKFPAKT